MRPSLPHRWALVPLLIASGWAQAATIEWNQWSSSTTGSIGGVQVTFTGNPNGFYASYPSWGPSSSFVDGSMVENAPTGGIVGLLGGSSNVQTVTFSSPVVNPVFTIWSLGRPGTTASFDFLGVTPVLVAAGPNAEYGGTGITVDGNQVLGAEGNGTLMFHGTFDSISWVNPTFENWYGFNVGIAGVVPEPQTVALMLAGLAVLPLVARRRRRG